MQGKEDFIDHFKNKMIIKKKHSPLIFEVPELTILELSTLKNELSR